MSNEDGKSMGLALILPLLLYIIYLIREIRSHLQRKSRIKRWNIYRKHKEAKLSQQNEEKIKYPSLVDLPGAVRAVRPDDTVTESSFPQTESSIQEVPPYLCISEDQHTVTPVKETVVQIDPQRPNVVETVFL